MFSPEVPGTTDYTYNPSKSVKTYLIGPGGAGKSTIFRQLSTEVNEESFASTRNSMLDQELVAEFARYDAEEEEDWLTERTDYTGPEQPYTRLKEFVTVTRKRLIEDLVRTVHDLMVVADWETMGFGTFYERLMSEVEMKNAVDVIKHAYTALVQVKSRKKFSKDLFIGEKLREAMLTLWKNSSFQQAWNSDESHHLKRYALMNFDFFMEQMMKCPGCWGGETWRPSFKEALHFYCRTTGVIESSFSYKEVNFSALDCGGVRCERRKLNSFLPGSPDEQCSIMFVVSLGDYDENLFEDYTTNKLVDALAFFEEFTQYLKYVDYHNFTLVFTKLDKFEKKFCHQRIPIRLDDIDGAEASICSPETTTMSEAFEWIKEQFHIRCNLADMSNFNTVTCNATQRSEVRQMLKEHLEATMSYMEPAVFLESFRDHMDDPMLQTTTQSSQFRRRVSGRFRKAFQKVTGSFTSRKPKGSSPHHDLAYDLQSNASLVRFEDDDVCGEVMKC